ncbi:hypothetical protein Dcar01_01093 [Deinococcus carri]|uniref:YCII-related domain-containing protein n=1 Tax=Deinococcus carri TaxID=1211323 RepID=A0ABP9W4T6_9DEIO
MNKGSDAQNETLEGYVVDLICLRRYRQDELLERAREHTRACALKGHCVESGYGLVGNDGRLSLLDPDATPQIVGAAQHSEREQGLRVRVTRERQDGEMHTTRVEEVPGSA